MGKLTSVLPDQIRFAMQLKEGQSGGEKRDENELPEYLREARKVQPLKSRSRGRKKSPKRAIKKKGRSRSMARWLDRSRSNSKGKSGQYVRATGWSSTVRWWEKKRESSSASRKGRARKRSRSRSRSRRRRSSSSSSRSS